MDHLRTKLMAWIDKEDVERIPAGYPLGGRSVGTRLKPNHNGQIDAAGHRELRPGGLWVMDLV